MSTHSHFSLKTPAHTHTERERDFVNGNVNEARTTQEKVPSLRNGPFDTVF